MKIQAVLGGKKTGIADQVTIDLALGCKNQCKGCYAQSSSRRGQRYFNEIKVKEFDKKVLIQSLDKVKKVGHYIGRIGKHCDPGDHLDSLTDVLETCGEQNFLNVVVSKSLPYNKKISKLFRIYNHILHISIGMKTTAAPSDRIRKSVGEKYFKDGVRMFYRITEDITRPPNKFYTELLKTKRTIITPMRYRSMKLLEEAGANKDDFKFLSGYYRPRMAYGAWNLSVKNDCGDLATKNFCCNCKADLNYIKKLIRKDRARRK